MVFIHLNNYITSATIHNIYTLVLRVSVKRLSTTIKQLYIFVGVILNIEAISSIFTTVTGLCLSSDGSYVLSNLIDNSLRIWNIQEKCVKILSGYQHNLEKNLLRCCWSPDGSKVSAGSADRYVYIWDTTTRCILYKLPGHNGSVNDVHFHPNEPIIMSGSSDKLIYFDELE